MVTLLPLHAETDQTGFTFYHTADTELDYMVLDELETNHREHMSPKPAPGETVHVGTVVVADGTVREVVPTVGRHRQCLKT